MNTEEGYIEEVYTKQSQPFQQGHEGYEENSAQKGIQKEMDSKDQQINIFLTKIKKIKKLTQELHETEIVNEVIKSSNEIFTIKEFLGLKWAS